MLCMDLGGPEEGWRVFGRLHCFCARITVVTAWLDSLEEHVLLFAACLLLGLPSWGLLHHVFVDGGSWSLVSVCQGFQRWHNLSSFEAI